LRTEISATQIGTVASQSFSQTKPQSIGQVVASFQNSFYIRTHEDELVFVTNRSIGSPITINLTTNLNFESLVPTGTSVSICQNQVLVGDLAMRIETARQYFQPAKPLPASKLRVDSGVLRHAAFIIGILDTNLSVLDVKGISHDQTRRFTRTAALPLRDSASGDIFQPEAEVMVGLGTGFTPSGDDLLGGFLAAWNTLASTIARSKIIIDFNSLSNKTSWISAKLLDYMQRELLDSQLSHIICSALNSEDEFILAFEDLIPRGHTSGLDISIGLVIALSLILDITKERRDTEDLLNQLGL